jgi:hypothetical protein
VWQSEFFGSILLKNCRGDWMHKTETIQKSATVRRYGDTLAVACAFVIGFAAFGDSSIGIADDGTTPRVAKRAGHEQLGNRHKLIPALDLARKSRQALAEVEDYNATFMKRELVRGRMHSHVISVKVREKPFSIYMKFQKPHAGREVLYVDGQNDGKLLAHDTGLSALAGTFKLDPTSRDAMNENRYPITMVGLSTMVGKIIEQWESDVRVDGVEVKYYAQAKLKDTECQVIESSHTKANPGAKFFMTRLYIDKKTNLPIRVEQYGFPKRAGSKPPLIEEYTYLNLRTNLNLTDRDFHPGNPQYDF